MNNLENASGNFLEMVECVQNGVPIQVYQMGKWWDARRDTPQDLLHYLMFNTNLEWRIKPDAFVCWWQSLEHVSNDSKVMALMAWNAAMEHKDDE